MDLNIYQKKVDNVFAENRILKFGFVVLLVMSIGNWHAINSAVDNQRVVIVPAAASGDFWISGNEASIPYLRQMARYVTGMISNYTAATARAQFEEILALYTPETYAEAKVSFEKLSDQIERHPTVSSRAIWSGQEPFKIDEENKIFIVSVTRERLVSGDVTQSENRFINIDYNITDGRFWIESIQEISKEKSK